MPRGCVIFDFDGVIADTESLHLAVYNLALQSHAGQIRGALVIPREAYFTRYIVYGDREGFFHMLRDHGRRMMRGLSKRSARRSMCFSRRSFPRLPTRYPACAIC